MSKRGVMMNISISVNLPPDVEPRPRAETTDLSAAVREGFAAESLQGHPHSFRPRPGLGLDRFETDALLKRHEVAEF